jgi:hypothetical protein
MAIQQGFMGNKLSLELVYIRKELAILLSGNLSMSDIVLLLSLGHETGLTNCKVITFSVFSWNCICDPPLDWVQGTEDSFNATL